MFEPLAEDRGMTIRAEAPDRLVALVHRELLGQALANLVDNALKYGSGAVTVRVESGPVLIVADDGPGIPPERRDEALKRFGRLDAARSESGAGWACRSPARWRICMAGRWRWRIMRRGCGSG
jgi:signal transduction histidine kinase